jgi:predicted ester cyclase
MTTLHTDSSSPSRAASSSAEANAALLRRYWPEANANGLLCVVDGYHHADVVSHPPASVCAEPLRGLDAYKAFVEAHFYTAFPDLKTTIENLVADGDMVGLRVTASGTNTGPIMGAPATGRPVVFSGMELFRVRSGRIAEQWGEFDGPSILQQLGLMPGAAAPSPGQDPAAPEPPDFARPEASSAGRAANVASIRRFYELFNQHDLSTVEQICTPGVLVHHGAMAQDLASAVAFAEQFFTAFPDAHNEIELIVADDATVLTRGVFTGTQQGAFLHLAPTGRQVTMSWMCFNRMEAGRIAERWVEQDTLRLLQQLS